MSERSQIPVVGIGASAGGLEALGAGARGYILKGDPDELPTAIRRVLDGERYLDEKLQGQQ